jgi:RES domain-containing protein
MVYTSEHLSLAVLELFVHLEPHDLLVRHYSFSAEIDDSLLEVVPPAKLPPDWAQPLSPSSTRDLGSEWARSGRSLGLVVPSAVVPDERNIVLNPAHPKFGRLPIAGPKPFSFDARMAGAPARGS